MVIHTEEGSPGELKLRKVQAAHTALEAKYKKMKADNEVLAKSKKESDEEREKLK